MFRLLIKTHNITGLKYLCVTRNEDYEKYPGSGVHWQRHLKKHGKDHQTEVIFETEDSDELTKTGLYYSSLYDVVESDEWANLIPESGYNNENINQINGWFGWYSSLSDAEISERNKNISAKVRNRFQTTDPNIISSEQKNRRLNSSKESREIRKKKIQVVYASGKHDALFKRYSSERQGAKNPSAQRVSIEGREFDCIKDAVETLNLTRAIMSNRIKSDADRWKNWKKI